MKQVIIEDDFDLDKIVNSGQSFRAVKIDKDSYRFCSGDKIIYLYNRGSYFEVDPINSSWNKFWHNYFDLDLNYQKIRSQMIGIDSYIDKAIDYSKGIRILRQDPYETLLSFIIAQRKTIPSIAVCVEKLSRQYGRPVLSAPETIHSFPTIEQLADIKLEELLELKLGYRTKYFKSAIDFINENNLDFASLKSLETKELIDFFKTFYGVGDKIASCITLFGYHRLDSVPVDVWIDRSIKEHFNSINPFYKYGEYAGLAQQYLFFYERNRSLSS